MTAFLLGHVAAFLRRVAPVAGMLAITAGILGMHIMTGSHSMTASATAPDAGMILAMHSPETGHKSHTPAADSSLSAATTSGHGSSCSDPGGCAMMTAMDASCIPSPSNAQLAAPLPGSTPFAVHGGAGTAAPPSTYSYLPGSPSPGRLCISRT